MGFGQRLSLVVRSYCLEAVWNFQRHQHVGVLFALLPVLRRGSPGRDVLSASMKRHCRYFNTHPYLAPALLGMMAKQEEVIQGSRKDATATIKDLHRVRGMIMGPLAALGDSAFWSALKPVTLILAVGWVLVAPGVGAWHIGGLAAIVFLYNAGQWWVRWKGMTWGYEAGAACLERFRILPSVASWGHRYGVAVVGLTVALTYSWRSITVSGVAMQRQNLLALLRRCGNRHQH